jgi:hypothetical protein
MPPPRRKIRDESLGLTVALGSPRPLGDAWENAVNGAAARVACPGRASYCAKLVVNRACGAAGDLLSYGQASATYCRWALFCCRASVAGSAIVNLRRAFVMACTRSSAAADHQPKSDPADAGRLPMGVLPHPAGLSARQHRRSGTAPVSGASPDPRPVEGVLPTRSGWQGPQPAISDSFPADPHVDNRRFVSRHRVSRPQHQLPGGLTQASSHTARCAAAGRRSGTMFSQGSDSEGTPPDS